MRLIFCPRFVQFMFCDKEILKDTLLGCIKLSGKFLEENLIVKIADVVAHWLGDVVAHWRICGGSFVVHQTSGAEVPGSNPAS